MTEFKNKFGHHISDDRLPAQSMFESFTEKLADGTFKAEPLSLVVSLIEEEQQDAKKPDHSRQYNLPFPLSVGIKVRSPQTKRGFVLNMPFLRTCGYWVRCVSRAGRFIRISLRTTFNDFLDTLLDRDNFNFKKRSMGRTLISPCWTFCLSYEFELRKEAFRLCKEQAMGVHAALWTALRNPEHRVKHWLQLVAIPNAPSSFQRFGFLGLEKANLRPGESTFPSLLAETHRCSRRFLVQLNLLFPHLQSRSGIERRERRQEPEET